MTQKKINGYTFRVHKNDHPPYHVHVLEGDKELGEFDIVNQKPMGFLRLTSKLRNALRKGGYLK